MKALARIAAILAICGVVGAALLGVASKIKETWDKFKSDFPDEEAKTDDQNRAGQKTEETTYQEIR